MKKIRHLLFTLVLSMTLAWTFGCSSNAPEQENPVVEPTEEVVVEPSAVPETPTSEPEVANYCVDCHTDKDRLISTAKVEEEVVSENEGAG